METETVHYHTWPKCLRLGAGDIELVAALDFGPRILHFGLRGGENVFAVLPGIELETPRGPWRIYGGHRLWAAPEHFPNTYHPDNDPVQVEERAGTIRLTGPIAAGTGLRKSIEIALAPEVQAAHVRHAIRNESGRPVTLSPWALSVMAPGGAAVVPLCPPDADPEGMAPTHAVALWPYSDPADSRWTWGRDFLCVRQDPEMETPQKVGVTGQEGWAAYVRAGTAFLKVYRYAPGRAYPDRNVSLEVYTDHRFLEVETLGPLQELAPGEEAAWEETWGLAEADAFHEVGAAAYAQLAALAGNLRQEASAGTGRS